MSTPRHLPAVLLGVVPLLPGAFGGIVPDAAPPVITIEVPNNGRVIEGSGRSTEVPITLRISSRQHTGAAIALVRRGSARAGPRCGGATDLVATSDTILARWPAGTAEPWVVKLVICGDDRDEADETIEFVPVAVTNAEVAPGPVLGRLVILDDDPPPGITVMDVTVTEGQVARVEVRLSAPSGQVVDVRLSTSVAGFPEGTWVATAGEACGGTVDFITMDRRVSVPAGSSAAFLEITTCPNVDYGTNPATLPGPGYAEQLKVVASEPMNATLVRATAVVLVRDP